LLVRTGEDLPGRSGVRQTRFFARLNSMGKPVSVEMPWPLGPRKRDHSSDWARDVMRNKTAIGAALMNRSLAHYSDGQQQVPSLGLLHDPVFMTSRVSSIVVGALAALEATAAAQPAPLPNAPVGYSIPASLGDGWRTSAPERMGIDRRRLEQMTESIRSHPQDNVHAVLIEALELATHGLEFPVRDAAVLRTWSSERPRWIPEYCWFSLKWREGALR
jgi:hypothetical protein